MIVRITHRQRAEDGTILREWGQRANRERVIRERFSSADADDGYLGGWRTAFSQPPYGPNVFELLEDGTERQIEDRAIRQLGST